VARKRREIHVVDRLTTSFRSVFPEEDDIPVSVESGEVDDGGLADDRKMRKSGVWRGKIVELTIGTIEVGEAGTRQISDGVIDSDASIASSSIVAVTSTTHRRVPELRGGAFEGQKSIFGEEHPGTRGCERATQVSDTAALFLVWEKRCECSHLRSTIPRSCVCNLVKSLNSQRIANVEAAVKGVVHITLIVDRIFDEECESLIVSCMRSEE